MSARCRFRPRITKKKHVFFFCPARALNCCRFLKKKHLILVDKEIIPKKTKFISRNKKFFACFFRRPHKLYLKYVKICFISSLSLTFPEICPMFFYLIALINFPENRWIVFFPKCFFHRPPSLDFGFSLI